MTTLTLGHWDLTKRQDGDQSQIISRSQTMQKPVRNFDLKRRTSERVENKKWEDNSHPWAWLNRAYSQSMLDWPQSTRSRPLSLQGGSNHRLNWQSSPLIYHRKWCLPLSSQLLWFPQIMLHVGLPHYIRSVNEVVCHGIPDLRPL